MIWTWLVYAGAVSLALGAAAWLVEYGLRLYGRPGRWAWAGALAGSVVVPLAALLLPSRVPAGLAPALAVGPVLQAGVAERVVGGWWPGVLPRLDAALGWLWLASSAAAALYLTVSYARLRVRRRGWREAVVERHAVLVSPRTGPAVVGIRRGRIVLPEWVLAADEPTRRLVLAHEAEHVAAGDARLLAAALGALVLTPWSPGAWWQVRRLRQATELDCDARVLARHADLRRYARLLLEVGARGGEESLVAAFAAPRSLLGRRIEALTARVPADRRRRALAAAGGAGVLLAAACLGPEPDRPTPTEVVGRPRVASLAADAPSQPRTAGVDTPAFTPYTKRPELTNREEVARLLQENYPPLLRDAGVGGRAVVWVHVDETGRVSGTRIGMGSGHDPLDLAALRVAEGLRFTPAENEGRPVATWIQLPIVFSPGVAGGSKQPGPTSTGPRSTSPGPRASRRRGTEPAPRWPWT